MDHLTEVETGKTPENVNLVDAALLPMKVKRNLYGVGDRALGIRAVGCAFLPK
jgi:hypothetical protein